MAVVQTVSIYERDVYWVITKNLLYGTWKLCLPTEVSAQHDS